MPPAQTFSSSWQQLPARIALLLLVHVLQVLAYSDGDPEHITAILGQSVQFNCPAHFPNDVPVPYVVQWEKKGSDIPIFIWYDDYPTHCSPDFKDKSTNACRVARVEPGNTLGLGLASLNLTNIQETDRGWYNCKVVLLNRQPGEDFKDNGTWYHLSVHAAPRFVHVPKEIYYVNIGDSIILNCQAEGTPDPEILWFKYDGPVQQSATVAVINDGTELRINSIRSKDLADYTCVARNGEGRIHHTVKVVIAGGAVITNPPMNQNKTEGDMVNFHCQGEGTPGNLSTQWYKEDILVHKIPGLAERTQITKEGSLIISQVKAEDSGMYVCEITNGIGRPQRASAVLAVEYPARVAFTPTIQYLPLHLSGIIHCHIESNPPYQFITWTKDKRIFDPFDHEGMQSLTNGSLFITKVTKAHAGDYTCTPYNEHGTSGTSGVMQVHVRDPPEVKVKPEETYVKNVGSSVTLPCSASGVPTPTIEWRRADGHPLPKQRHEVAQGVLKIHGLVKKDHGVYECVVTNDVATLTVQTNLIVERTSPHAPHNVTVTRKETFGVTIEWMPGYSGCSHCKQTYKIRYKEKDSRMPNWIELPVHPPEARRVQIHNLSQGTTYQFQVVGMNEYGDGMYSQIVDAQTKDIKESDLAVNLLSIDELTGAAVIPEIPHVEDAPANEKPGKPVNVSVVAVNGGWVISWKNPESQGKQDVLYYTIEKKEDSQTASWGLLTDHKIEPEEASYLIKNMGTAKGYMFRVFAHSATSFTSSDEFKYPMPEDIKNRAITAGLVGGVLFFIVAIIVSVCTVKICNRRKRRKQEQAYNMVACRMGDTRNGGGVSQVPLKRLPESGIPVVNLSGVKHGLETVFDCVTNCVVSMESGLLLAKQQTAGEFRIDGGGGDQRRKQPARYSIRLEYSSVANKSPSSTKLLSSSRGGNSSRDLSRDDEGGFDLKLPPNRFRTRSIAIVAGYSPERLYSNMPPGAFVVESGVYKVGADRDYVKSEPIYWKQVVYGSRGGGGESDGSGTYPRRPATNINAATSTQVLHGPRLVARPNLHLSVVNDTSGVSHGGSGAPLLRASSPLEQGVPLVDWLSPVNNYSDISSVPQMGERSFPSTLLTNPLSSISSPNTFSSSQLSRLNSGRLTTPSSLLLHTIPEGEVSAYSTTSQTPSRLSVMADIHQASGAVVEEEEEEDDEGRRYSNLSDYSSGRLLANTAQSSLRQHWSPDGHQPEPSISYPGHQLGLPPSYYFYYSYYNNLPAPVHLARRAISPSTQYPLQPPTAMAAVPHIQPPQDIPDIRVSRVDPKEMDIYQRIAQLDPERATAPGLAVGRSARPLATSSPPGKRRKKEEKEVTEATSHYHENAARAGGSGGGKPRLPTPPVVMAGPQVSYIAGRKRGGVGGSKMRLQTLRELSEAETASSSNAGYEDTETTAAGVRRGMRSSQLRDSDLVSVVSEGLDAEVTAITSSSSSLSSPEGSGAANTLQHHGYHSTTSSSGIATRSSRNTTNASSSSFNSSQQNQTLHSSSSGSFSHHKHLQASPSGKRAGEGDESEYDSDLPPTYENWPPRPYLPPPPHQQSPANAGPMAAIAQRLEDFTSKLAAETTSSYVVGYQVEKPPAPTSGVPPLTAHYPHQAGRYHARVGRAGSAGPGSANTSLDTPSPTAGGGGGRQYSRPNSSQSAPLDRSVDRHYEWDTGTPPATEKGGLPAVLPPEWAAAMERRRRSPAYNPRRDRDIGMMVQMANRDRVFSDSEIYSNVFPRARGAQQRLAMDVEARVRAMKREFQEFRQAQQQQIPWPTTAAAPSAPSPPIKEDPAAAAGQPDRLESLI